MGAGVFKREAQTSALLKEYPNKMLVTVTQCVFSTVQSFVVAVVAEKDFSKWNLRLDISLVAIVYTVSDEKQTPGCHIN
ncbi:WAT1-related protein [Panicum miliaceum]|uniref:WAT1-related protein n=1 Tax=Panicum miliaceum TaxID=4540 RepID=A0A3L6R751_PANMI|nr:WAT1-related protein [Panicum miliaceum]